MEANDISEPHPSIRNEIGPLRTLAAPRAAALLTPPVRAQNFGMLPLTRRVQTSLDKTSRQRLVQS
jgi:hypothetical protein